MSIIIERVRRANNPVRGTLALPQDIDLGDVDWSPLPAATAAPRSPEANMKTEMVAKPQ